MPCVTSAAAASSQSGEKPNAKIEPSSTTLPPAFRTASFFGDGSNSPATASACTLDAADELDRDPQEVLGRRLVEARRADEPRQDELGRLVDRRLRARRRPREGAAREARRGTRVGGARASSRGASRLRADGDSAERGEPVERQRRCVRDRPASGTLDRRHRPPIAFTLDSTLQPAERESRSRRRASGRRDAHPGASCASRRSTAIPPNHANIDPPRNAVARLFSSTPSKIATSATSSLSASPRDGNTASRQRRRPSIPAQNPSLKSTSARTSRTAAGYPSSG